MPNQLVRSNISSQFFTLATHCDRLGLSEAAIFAKRIAEDLENAHATVLVCGEFKRGKSSLVNALIGNKDMLPVDILPTTAVIHLLRYGEPGIAIHWRDGHTEQHPLDFSVLRRFSSTEVGGAIDPEQVEFVEIALHNDLLVKGLVLIDTPGTNDLNKTRSEIVYRMIPRADAVIFVLDATTQVTRTEASFLRDRLLASMAPPLCFVLNKLDRIDADEREDALEAAHGVIKEHLPLTDIRLLPASTTDQSIGIQPVIDFIHEFLSGGERHAAAVVKRNRMFDCLRNLVLDAIAQREQLMSANVGELQNALTKVQSERNTFGSRLEKFISYMRTNGLDMLIPMIHRSFELHIDELSRRLVSEAKSYGNPATYAENQLPLNIESSFKHWLEMKIVEISYFTNRYQQAMLHEYHRVFGDDTVLGLRPDASLATMAGNTSFRVKEVGVTVDNPDDQKAMLIRFGLPTAGVLIAATVATAGTALIVGSMAGSLLGHHFAKQRLDMARETLVSKIPAILQKHGENFIGQIVSEVEKFLNAFVLQLTAIAQAESKRREDLIREALDKADGAESERAKQRHEWQTLREEVNKILADDKSPNV